MTHPRNTIRTQGVQEIYGPGELFLESLLVKINGFKLWYYGQELTLKWSPLLEAHAHRLPPVLAQDHATAQRMFFAETIA